MPFSLCRSCFPYLGEGLGLRDSESQHLWTLTSGGPSRGSGNPAGKGLGMSLLVNAPLLCCLLMHVSPIGIGVRWLPGPSG